MPMIARWMDALFGPTYPRHDTGRHRGRRPERKVEPVAAEAQPIR
jgi:hypothetical protein